MGVLADTLGGKSAGELIRATDWNALIDAIEGIEAALGERIDTLSDSVDTRFGEVTASLDEIRTSVETLETEVTELRTDVDELRARFRRVTIETTRSSFAIGELAQLTARITDLDGTPLTFPTANTRPWVDFVTVWGQLRPVTGFESRGGAGDRSISVRVDANGIARVQLRAEHVEGFSEEAELEVSAALMTVTEQAPLRDIILQSNTPMEANERGAFRILSNEYARSDASSVRNYVDAYYIRYPDRVTGHFTPGFQTRWRDYNSTVIALAKADSDPLTPDASLGSSSIQVTFRDWIGPWYNLDFVADEPELADLYADRFRGLVADDYRDTLLDLEDAIDDVVRDKGVLGRHKEYRAVDMAVGRIVVDNPPIFLDDVTRTLQNGIAMQQAAEYGQTAAFGAQQESRVLRAMADTGAKADTRAAEVAQTVTGQVESQLGQAREELVFQVQREQATFRSELLAESGPILNVQRELQTVAGQVQGFQVALNAKADVQALARFLPG